MSSPPEDESSFERVDLSDDTGSSYDILTEEIKSSLRTVQAISEQLVVEKASMDLIDLLAAAEDAVKASVETPAPRRIARLSGGSTGSKELGKEAKATIALLDDTILQVKELHIATIQRQVKRSVTLGAIEYLRSIETAVKDLITYLSGIGDSSPKSGLENFAGKAKKWIRSSGSLARPTSSRGSTLLASSSASQSFISASSNSSSSTAFTNRNSDSCPMETALRSANIFGRLSNNLDDFTSWALREKQFSEVHSQVGSVQSVHLFREREAPLHHEFVLISIGGKGLKTSWMRLERAALLKSRKFLPKWDSFGPIFQGAPLRESISIAASRDDLCGKADELGSVTIDSAKSGPPFYLDELAKQLVNTSGSRPQYQLLTANCRWFARSTLLNSALRFSQDPSVSFSWQGPNISFQTIHDKLIGDRFGGKQLEGPRAALLLISNKLEDLSKQLIDAKPKAVLGALDQLMMDIDKVSEKSNRRQYLTAYAYLLRGTALRVLNHFSAALVPFNAARDLLISIREEDNDYELLYLDAVAGIAYAAYLRKSFEEARVLRLEIVSAWRKQRQLYTESDIDATLGLSRALGFYARTLPGLRSEEFDAEADRAINEALSLVEGMYERRDDLAAETLAWVLSQKASILADIIDRDNVAALSAASASVDYTRTLYSVKPDMMRRSLACRLLVMSVLANRLEKWDEACDALRECIELYRILYGLSPRSFCIDLEARLASLVKTLRRASTPSATLAITTIQKLTQSLRLLFQEEGGEINRQVLIFFLQIYSYLLGKSSCEAVRMVGSRDELRKAIKTELETLGVKMVGKPKVGTGLAHK